jgi:hypothetical protein
MRVRALKTHINGAQQRVSRGAEYDLEDRDAEERIELGLVERVEKPAGGGVIGRLVAKLDKPKATAKPKGKRGGKGEDPATEEDPDDAKEDSDGESRQ